MPLRGKWNQKKDLLSDYITTTQNQLLYFSYKLTWTHKHKKLFFSPIIKIIF